MKKKLGGKSNTFNTVLQPVVDHIHRRHLVQIHLENYIIAGIQKHQLENKGYGLKTGYEENRFLSSISVNQSKGEAEKSLSLQALGWTRRQQNACKNEITSSQTSKNPTIHENWPREFKRFHSKTLLDNKRII